MRTLTDVEGTPVRLTDERWAHILEHPEMSGQEQKIAEALQTPDVVVCSPHDPAVRLYHRLHDETPVTRKYLVVVVKHSERGAFIITAFFTDRQKRGVRIWPP